MGENQQNRRMGAGAKKQNDARRAARRAAREAVLALLFETEYHEDEAAESIYLRAAEVRGLVTDGEEDAAPVAIEPRDERYVRATYLGIMSNLEAIDEVIGRHATGWRTGRLSRVSRAVLRLGAYELVYAENIPAPVAINEAVELCKKYDAPRARAFINGVLNAIKNEIATATATAEKPAAEIPAADTASDED